MLQQILSLIIPLIYMINMSICFSTLFKKKFEYTLPIGLMAGTLTLFLFGFIHLYIGAVIVFLLSFGWLPVILKQKKTGSYDGNLKECSLSPMLFTFLVIYFVVFMMNIGKRFSVYDEFSHWGVMVKDMLYSNHYYYRKDTFLNIHNDYPPLPALIEYFWCRMSFSYSERHLYNAKILFVLSLYFPITGKLMNANRQNAITHTEQNGVAIPKLTYLLYLPLFILFLGVCISPGEARLYNTIYPEMILISLFLLGCFTIVGHEEDHRFYVLENSLLLSCILLTKEIGLYFFGILFGMYFLGKIFCHKERKNKKRVFLSEIVFMWAGPLILRCFWSKMADLYATPGQFDSSKFSLEALKAFIHGNGIEYQYKTLDLFKEAVFHKELWNRYVPLSYVRIVIVLCTILLVTGIAYYYLEGVKKEYYIQTLVLLAGAAVYVGVMLVAYLYGFTSKEALALASFRRYMLTYLCPLVMFALICLTDVLIKWKNTKDAFSLMLIAMLALIIPTGTLEGQMKPGFTYDDIANEYLNDVDILKEKTSEKSKIFFVCQGDNGLAGRIIAYHIAPRYIPDYIYSFEVPSEDHEKTHAITMTVEQFTEYLYDYDYLYLCNIDRDFIDGYSRVFNKDIRLDNEQLYKINKNAGNKAYPISLEYVE